MENSYTIDDFEMETVICTEKGEWSNYPFYSYAPNGKYDVNLSSILTLLIQKAGHICKHYASDLFITWISFDKRLENPDYAGEKILFGFREMGVDSNTYVLCRLNNYGLVSLKAEVEQLFMMNVEVNDKREISVTLGTVNEDKFRQFISNDYPFEGRALTFSQMHEVYRDMVADKKKNPDFDYWLEEMVRSGVFEEV